MKHAELKLNGSLYVSSGYRYIYQGTFKNREEVLKFLKGKAGK
ncbi:hypothetical protein [Leptotrichia sp. oral taxon 879]|nr:hypothetical protein [Leptotrichia sp. oral taxon 879]ERK48880.1 hypothetical protein HMPREF1552_01911 [Leptotrichia sp. oral taxon 879 str. F0557]